MTNDPQGFDSPTSKQKPTNKKSKVRETANTKGGLLGITVADLIGTIEIIIKPNDGDITLEE